MPPLTFSRAPLTLGDLIDITRARRGDFEALLRLLVRRTGQPEGVIRELTVDEIRAAIAAFDASLKDSLSSLNVPAATVQ